MTPKEEKWLAEYKRQEARQRIKMLYRTLIFWGVFTIVCLIIQFSYPEEKFSFSNSLILLMIIINVGNAIREIIRNKRIAADGNSPETGHESIDGNY